MRDGTPTRLRIEAEAMALFVEKSVAETSIRDLAQAAGIAEGALYRHFPGKDALVAHLFTEHYLGFSETLDRLQAGAKGTRAKLDQMIGEFCRFFDADRILFRFLLLVQHGQIEKLPRGRATPVDVICRVIAQGMRHRELPKGDAEFSAAMIMGLVLQTATAAVYGRLRGPMTPRASKLSAAAWAALTAT
jgi:AcrR family transcriptional regulator